MKETFSENAIDSIVIVNGDSTELESITQLLNSEKYRVVGFGNDFFDAVRMIMQIKPDLLIVDSELPEYSILDISKNLAKENYVNGIIFVVNKFEDKSFFKYQCDKLISIVERPLTEEKITIAVKSGEIYLNNINRLSKQLRETEKKLLDRKKIDRAKGILIDSFELSESSAYRYMQKESMSKQIAMSEVAEVIILTHI